MSTSDSSTTGPTAGSSPPGFGELASVGRALWWLVLLRGIAAIVFGVLAIVFPEATLVALAILFAAYALVDGVMTIIHAVRVRTRRPNWGWLLAQGIVSVLAGVAAALFPSLAGFLGATIVLWLIAFWSIFLGVSGLFSAHAVTGDGGRRVWAYVLAALSLIFGVVLIIIVLATPMNAVISLVWVVGVYAILLGLILVVVAITVRSSARRMLADRSA